MTSRTLVFAALAFAMSMLGASEATGTAQRTFVASYGATANTAFNCSLSKPCRAFSEAINVTNPGGEVVVLDSAGYGPVTITQSVSIIAPAGVHAGVTVFTGDGVAVIAPGATVVLRGLAIAGQGGASGISVQQAARVRIESCLIANILGNGIVHSAPGAEMIVLDTIVRDNGGVGIGIGANATAVLDHIRSEHNGGDGLSIQPVNGDARAVVTDSIFAFNGGNGVNVLSSAAAPNANTAYAHIERSVLADNGTTGLRAFGVGPGFVTVAMTGNSIHRNAAEQVAAFGSGAVRVTLTGNTLVYDGIGISADGGNVEVSASANTLSPIKLAGHVEFAQTAGAKFNSYNNNVSATYTATGTITPATGI